MHSCMVKPSVKLSFYSQCDLFLHMNGPSFKLVMFQKVLFSSQKEIVLKMKCCWCLSRCCATGICWEGLSPQHRHGNYFRSSRKELYYQCTSQTQDRELPLSTQSSRAEGDNRLLNQLCCWQQDSAACHCQAHGRVIAGWHAGHSASIFWKPRVILKCDLSVKLSSKSLFWEHWLRCDLHCEDKP